jgi:hypothetical protein
LTSLLKTLGLDPTLFGIVKTNQLLANLAVGLDVDICSERFVDLARTALLSLIE